MSSHRGPISRESSHAAGVLPVDGEISDSGVSPVASQVALLLANGRLANVVGTPGSGLTTTLQDVHTHLLSHWGLSPDDVLVLTPNRAHADVMRNSLSAGSRAVRTGGAAARSLQSYAFGLVAADSAVRVGEPMRFLSGADQDALLASLLKGYAEGLAPDPHWPESFTPEMTGTVEFRDQLRDALDRVLERGIEPIAVDSAAQRRGRGEWSALARILQDYQDLTTAFAGYGGIDASRVIATAVAIIEDERSAGAAAGDTWTFSPELIPRCILIDAAQDLPDAVLRLIDGLRSLGCGIAVFGSPDSSTQGFRGAGGGLLAQWASTVRSDTGEEGLFTLPAHHSAARGTGAARDLCISLSRRISSHLELGHIPSVSVPHQTSGSQVRVLTHRSSAERTRHLAALIRSWHHDDEVEFSDIAVIARTSGTAVALRAELGALGLPVESTDLPLSADPATVPLLTLLTADLSDPSTRASLLDQLLRGAFGSVDALALRSLRRQAVRALAHQDLPVGDDPLMVWVEESDPGVLPEPLAKAAALVELGDGMRAAGPHEALWALWQATGVADSWRAAVLKDPRSPLRERLDAVMRLFTLAMKTEDTVGLNAGAFANRVLDQVYAQDSLSSRDALDLLTVDSPAGTAHRSFSRVAVVDVDEGSWPNPRIRRSVFHPEELIEELWDPEAAAQEDEPGAEVRRKRMRTIRDESSLFLAAVSRARDELVVCAVDDGETSPSALHHFSVDFETLPAGGLLEDGRSSGEDGAEDGFDELPPRLRDIVGVARRQLLTSEEPDEWADLVAALAGAGLREADPQTWSTWFSVSSDSPARSSEEAVRISPSHVERFATCPLQWFLVDCGGRTPDTSAANVGTAVHAIAEHHTDPDRAAMLRQFDDTFDFDQLPSDWERERLRGEVESMIDTLCDYLVTSRAELAAISASGKDTAVLREVTVRAVSGSDAVGAPWTVSGRIDRLEVLGDRVRVVDFKTGKTVTSANAINDDAQLLVYQYAVTEGDVMVDGKPDVQSASLPSGGAHIVHLRGATSRVKGVPRYLREQPAMVKDDEAHVRTGDLIGRAAEGMRQPQFTAVTGPHCVHCPVRSSCPAIAVTTPEGDEA